MIKKFKIFENTSRGLEIVYTFKTKAKSDKYEYTIQLLQGDPSYDKTISFNQEYSYNGLVLSINGTPGSWYVSTFLHYTPGSQYNNIISIQGNDWVCTNKREIVKELLEWIETEYPFYKEMKKYNI